MSEIKNGRLDQYGAEPFEQQQFGSAGVEGVKPSGERGRRDNQGAEWGEVWTAMSPTQPTSGLGGVLTPSGGSAVDPRSETHFGVF